MEEKRLSLGDHLDELRSRVLRSLLVVVVCVAVAFIFHEKVMYIIRYVYDAALENTALKGAKLTIMTFPEAFLVPFKASLIAGLIVASPYIFYQVWKFIGAGLFPRERKYIILYAPFSLILFAGGAIFGYFIFIPMVLEILSKFVDLNFYEPMFRLSDYFSLFIGMTLMLGAVFEIPLVMFFFAHIGLVTPRDYLSYYKMVILGSFVLAAMITPDGNPINQSIIAALLIFLYMTGVLLSFLFFRKRNPGNNQ